MDVKLVARMPMASPTPETNRPSNLGTEIPEVEVVRPAAPAPKTSNSQPDTGPARDKRFVESPANQGMVFVMTDAASGAVLMQLPSEQSVKLRAYRESLERRMTEARKGGGVLA